MTISATRKALATSLLGTLIVAGFGSSTVAHANAVDDAADACREAARLLIDDDDLDGALEEATWCLTALNQLKDEITLSLLPDELDGYIGGEIENEDVMGLKSLSRIYTRDGDSLTVTLVTSGGAGGALAGLGELGKLFGGVNAASGVGNGKQIRIQRRTVFVSEENGTAELKVDLKSGANLQVESNVLDSDDLIEFMQEFPITEIDEATTG